MFSRNKASSSSQSDYAREAMTPPPAPRKAQPFSHFNDGETHAARALFADENQGVARQLFDREFAGDSDSDSDGGF